MSPQIPANVPPIDDWGRLLDGRVAVVTGGGDGIGGAISRLFARHGAHVEIAEIDPDRASRIAEEIDGDGGSARVHVVDVTAEADVARLAEDVLAAHPHVSVLVNNVGDYRPLVRFPTSSPESWKAMYDINLFHVFAVTQAFVGSMIEHRSGSIVNVHSVEGLRGYPGDPVYGAFKAAAAAFTTDLAVGLGRRGVRVNGIGPDLTQTPAGRLPDRVGGRRRPLGGVGPGGSSGLARGPGPRGAVPGVGPLRLRHRPQHPGRRGHPCRRWLVLVALGEPVREPSSNPLDPSGTDQASGAGRPIVVGRAPVGLPSRTVRSPVTATARNPAGGRLRR